MFEIKFEVEYYTETHQKLNLKITENMWKIISIEIINKLNEKILNILSNNFSFIGNYYNQIFYLTSENILYNNEKTKKEIEIIEDIIGYEVLKQIEKYIKNYENVKIVSVKSNVLLNSHKRKTEQDNSFPTCKKIKLR